MSYDNPLNSLPDRPPEDPFRGSERQVDLSYMMTPEPEPSIGPLDVVGRTLHVILARPLPFVALFVSALVLQIGITALASVMPDLLYLVMPRWLRTTAWMGTLRGMLTFVIV